MIAKAGTLTRFGENPITAILSLPLPSEGKCGHSIPGHSFLMGNFEDLGNLYFVFKFD